MKKIKLLTLTMVLAVFTTICLPGCTGKNTNSEVSGSGSTSSEASAGSSFDWHTQTFSINEKIEEDSLLSITDFYLWEHKNPDSAQDLYYGTDGTNFYVLEGCFQSETAENICLSIYDPAGGNHDRIMLPAETFEEEQTSLFVTAFSILSPEEFFFQITIPGLDEKGRIYPEQYRVVRMNSQGGILSDVDMLPLYESRGMISAGTLNPVADCILDGDGCIYTRSYSRSSLLIAGTDGSLLMEKDYGDESKIIIGDPILSDDGKLVFPVMDYRGDAVRLVWFDAQNSKEYTLAELEYLPFRKLYAMHGRHIYYGTRDGIIDWDTESGKRSEIFRYKDNAIPDNGNTMLAFDGEGNPLLRVVYEKEDMLFVLGEQDGGQETVRIADLSGKSSDLLKPNIAAFSRRNPLCSFSYEKPEEGLEEDYRSRIMAELASGAGPDILCLSREDLVILQEKGVLADLEGFISQDTLRELLPGAVGLGRVNGTLSGIPGEVVPWTVFTIPETWDAGSWTISDILGLMQDRDPENTVEAILPTDGVGQLIYLVLLDLEHSAFIDWENNTCSFATGEFASLLKIFKTYSINETLIGPEGREMVCEGTCLGVWAPYINFMTYQMFYREMGEDIKAVGFPSETGNGNYMTAQNGILAVNANTASKEAVSAFLEYVLGIEGQGFRSATVSVRKNMITEDMIFYDKDNNPCIKWDQIPSYDLLTRKDGSVYIRQYNEFLESCVPMPDSHDELVSIIREEAEAFFGGDKTAEQTAEIIQSRVQLYLDEHN